MPNAAPPALTALQLPDALDLSAGDAAFELSLSASDDTGIDYVVVEFDRGLRGPAGLASFVHVRADPGEDWGAGQVSATVTADRRTEPGTISVSRVWVWDLAGNSRRYDPGDLAALGADTQMEVTGSAPDIAAPRIDSLSLSASVDVASGGGTLSAAVAAGDDTGVAAVELFFDTPLVRPDGVGDRLLLAPGEAGGFADGPVAREVALTGANADGTVSVTRARVWDIHGNGASYDASEIAAAGWDGAFAITGGAPDFEPPELSALGLPDAVDVSGGPATLALSLSARDAAGISHAQLYLTRPVAGLAFDFLSFYVAPAAGETWTTGTLVRDFAISGEAVPGEIGVRELHVFDTLGNGRIYEAADLEELGLATSFRIVDATRAPDFALTRTLEDGAVRLALVNAGPARVNPEIGLDLVIDAPGAGTPVAEQGPAGTLDIDRAREGDRITYDLVAQLGATLESGATAIEITLPYAGGGALAAMVTGAALDGDAAVVAPTPRLVFGTAAGDELPGGPAAEEIAGRGGDDRLAGGRGDDTLTGGAGADIFAIAPGGGADRITDFEKGVDRLDLAAFDRAAALAALGAAGPEPARLSFADGTEIALDGLTQAEITAADARLAPAPREGAVWIAQRLALGAEPVTVAHGWRFDSPVAIAGPPGMAGAPPAAVRIHAVTETTVTLALDRPGHLGGPAPEEEVTLVVAEAGAHRLPDGTLIQAGTLQTDRMTPQGFAQVAYAERFAAAPAVLTQVQTANDPAFVVTRQTGADESGLRLALQEEEARLFGTHGTETVGWIAVQAGPGLAVDPSGGATRFEAGRTGPAVTDGGDRHDFARPFAEAPGLAAALSSFADPDPAVPRLTGIDAAGFAIRAQEEASLDLETAHAAESVDYLAPALPEGGAAAVGTAFEQIGEVHRLVLSGEARTVPLSRSYDTPVVLAQGASFYGPDPVTVRLLDVAADSVSLRLQEPNYLDDWHVDEEVTLLVIEAGRHVLADGTRLEAGIHTTDRLTSAGYDRLRFDAAFDAPPVLLSTVMTRGGPDWVVTRHEAVGARGFGLAMQEEEALNGGIHTTEQVGWLAIEAGRGAWSGLDWEAGTASGVTSDGARHAFGAPFDAPPAVVANLATPFGVDPATPRLSGIDAAGFTAWAQEEASLDAEVDHVAERLDYVAFSGAGVLSGVPRPPVIAEAGTLGLTHVPVTIELGHSFENPVAFAFATTANGGQPATVRVESLGPDRLSLAMQEPVWLDGLHAPEQVTWLVVEQGAWRLADGRLIEAGAATVEARGRPGLTDVAFSAPFDAAPVTLAQVQALPEPDFLDTRQEGARPAGFRVTVEGEEARNALPQPPQEVGWLAMEPGAGLWEAEDGGTPLSAGTTGQIVTDAPARLDLAGPFDAAPLLLAGMTSYYGDNPSVLRASGLDASGAELRVQEDQSADAETAHIAETVGFVGLGGAGLLLGEPWAG